jgi:ELWxxDGT repeat protein
MKRLITLLFICFYLSSFGQVQRIYDSFQGDYGAYHIFFSGTINNQLLFIQKTNDSSPKLLVSDGTSQNTRILDETDNTATAFIFKNKLYYQKRIGLVRQIYRTDGTTNGGNLFIDTVDSRSLLFATNDLLFFSKNEQLWRTDGTAANTYAITDSFFDLNFPHSFRLFLGKVYFETRNDGKWLIEGDVVTAFSGFTQDRLFFNGIEFNGVYYTAGETDEEDCELWRTDGTSQGTYMLKDLDPRIYESGSFKRVEVSSPRGFQIVNNKLLFLSDLGIWESDGTPDGTILIKSIENINHSYYSSRLDILFGKKPLSAVVNGKLIIEIENTNHGNEIWVSDGTEAGTYVLDVFEGSGNGLNLPTRDIKRIAILDGYLYFEADNGVIGQELWRTDGTIAGTNIVKDANPGIKSSTMLSVNNTDDQLFFISQTENERMAALYVMNKDASPENPVIDNAGIEFHKVIGKTSRFDHFHAMNESLEIDNDGNIFVLGKGQSNDIISFFNDNLILPEDKMEYSVEKCFVAKYNKLGEMQWVNYTHGGSYDKMTIAFDNDNKIIIGGHKPEYDDVYSDISFFGENIDISNQAEYRTGYIVKLNQNGEQEWSKFLDGYNEKILDVSVDEQNQIYILTNRGLVKCDENGNTIWKEELFFNGQYREGFIEQFNQFIYIVNSSREVNGGIRNDDIKEVSVIKYTLDGSQVWKKKFKTATFVSVNDFTISPQGELAIIGDYVDKFTTPPFEISPIGEQTTSSFQLRMDRNGEVTQLLNDTISDHLYNIAFNNKQQYYTTSEIALKESNAYVGFESYRDFPDNWIILSVKKYDHLHRLIEERIFHSHRYDMDTKMKLTSDNKILMSGLFYEQLDTLSFGIQNRAVNIHLLKFALNEEPNPEPTWEIDESLSVSISPNPTRGMVNVRIIEPTFSNYDLFVYDAKGQLIDYYEKRNDNEYETYNLNKYQSGVYFFRFRSEEEETIKRLVFLGE